VAVKMRTSGWVGSAGEAGLFAEERTLKPDPARIPAAAVGVAVPVHYAVSLVVEVVMTVLQECLTLADPGVADEAW